MTRRPRKPLWIAGVLFLVLIPAALLAARHPTTTQAAWFDTAWGYRTRIDLANSTGSNQTDFQVQVSTDTASLVTAGKMLSNCNDMRFTDTNGKLLKYWIEPNTCNTTTTKVFVKVPSVPTAGASIYMYYGNPGATSLSSDTDTFIRVIPNLKYAYDMDEASWTADCSTASVLDKSGNAYNAKSCPNGTGATGGATGKYGNAGTFDGAVQYLDTNYSFSASYNTSVTYSVWINPATISTGAKVKTIIGKTDFDLDLYQVDNKVKFEAWNAGGSDIFALTSTGSLTVGTWTQFTVVYDGTTHKATIYLNGAYDSSQTALQNSFKASPETLKIGKGYGWSGSPTPLFQGTIDNVRIYNGYALSANEVADLYGTAGSNQGYVTTNYPGKELVRKYSTGITYTLTGTEENSLGPVLWLKMDEGTGNILKDSSGKGNNSSAISGSTKWATEDQCISGKCLDFPASAGAVAFSVPNSNSLNFGTNSFTVEGWGFFRDYTYPKNTFMLKKTGACYSTPNTTNTGFDINTSYNANGFNVCLNDGTNRANGNISFDTGYKPADFQNKWTHFAVVFDRTANRIKVYVNGVKQTNELDTSAVTGSISNTSQAVIIGSSYGWQTDGRLDDIRLYPQARTAAQILDDFNSRGGNTTNTSIGVQSTTFLNNGLIGYLKMDEATWSGTTNEVYDFSGKNASGTAQGPTSAKSYPIAGMFGSGGYFDGIDDSVGLNQLTTLPNTITISTWIKPSSLSTSNGVFFGAAQGFNTFFGSITSTGELTYRTSSVSTYSDLTTSGAGLQTGKWYHVVFTQDATSRKLYINGVQKASDTNILWTNAVTNFSLGVRAAGSSFSTLPYNGIIDEFRIYNRALSAGEITQLYQWAPGPVGWWKMDEKTGTSAVDSSGSNNNSSTFTGSPTWVPGKFGAALSLSGAGNYASIPLSQTITNNYTVEGWINFNTRPSGTDPNRAGGLIGGTSSPNGTIEFITTYAVSGNTSQIGLGRSSDFSTLVSTGSFPMNTWTHVAATVDASNQITYYINGVNAGTANGTGHNLNLINPIIIGDNVWRDYRGQIDDVKIYNYVRTPSQVIQDMNGDHPVGGSPVGSQVIYYKFNEGVGNTVNNSISSSYAATTYNSTPWSRDGKFEGALNLNGSTNYALSSNILLSSDQTFSAWVKPNAVSGFLYGVFTQHDHAATANLGINISSSHFCASIGYTDATREYSTKCTIYTVPVGQWSYVALTFNQSTNTIAFYVNGVFDSSWVLTKTVKFTNNPILIGQWSTTYIGSYQYGGLIDEAKVYSAALTAQQIATDYNAGATLNFGTGTASESGTVIDGPGNAPIAYWSFDEKTGSTVNDRSGIYNNPGTWNGTLGSQWAVGKYNAGGNFNGSNNYVNVPNPAANLLDVVSNDLTIGFWFKPTSGSLSHRLIQKGNPFNAGGTGYSLIWRGDLANKPFYVQLNDTTFNTGSCAGNFVISTGNVDYSGSWHYLSWIISKSTNTTYIYVDGKLVGTAASISTCSQPLTSTAAFQIGGSSGTITGQIDEVKVYNYARTPAQIAYDYNRGAPIAMWRFDECQGTTLHDSTGNGYDGTWAGGTSIGTCTTPSTAWGNGATGKLNSSLSFAAASSDYLNVPAGITLGNDMTLAAWIKTGTTTEKPVISDRTGTGRTYFGTSTSGKAMLYYNSASPASISSTKTVTDNVWHHIVYTRFGTTSTLYIDGIQDNQITQTGFVAQNTAIRIGHDVSNVTEYFNGLIDDVRIYGYALSPSQVKNLFNDNSSVRYGPTTGTP